jgi:hypothetical protein
MPTDEIWNYILPEAVNMMQLIDRWIFLLASQRIVWRPPFEVEHPHQEFDLILVLKFGNVRQNGEGPIYAMAICGCAVCFVVQEELRRCLLVLYLWTLL